MSELARLLRALNVTTARQLGPDIVYASDAEAILASLRMIEATEIYGADLLRLWSGRLESQLAGLDDALNLEARAPDLASEVTALRTAIAQSATDRDAETDLLRRWSDLAGRITADTRLAPDARARLALEIARAERQRTVERMGAVVPVPPEADTEINAERLRAYLVDRFSDPSITIADFRLLPGGYGKETTLFEVRGSALDGQFVMRRDRLAPTMDNDCHRIERETPVIRAAFERGFPAPDAAWLDTEHKLLPGGHFLVMRRASGTTGGDVFGASGKVGDELTDLLASSVGKLHSLPPLRELGTVSEGIAPELWDLSLKEVTTRYISSIRDIYIREMIAPSPAVLGFYGWLLDNVPDAPGRPVLLHGDIGFHNMIVDNGRLTAVVDWEFAHIGDPAEDVGYVRNTTGSSIDWDRFMRVYRESGGGEISAERLRFFQIWGHLRNLTACQLTSNAFTRGTLDELKLAHVGHSMTPMFLDAIMAVIES